MTKNCDSCGSLRTPSPGAQSWQLASHLREIPNTTSDNGSTKYTEYRCSSCGSRWLNTRDIEDHGSYWDELPEASKLTALLRVSMTGLATLQDEEIFVSCPTCGIERTLSRLNTEEKNGAFSYVCPARCSGAIVSLTEVRAGSELAQAGHPIGKVVVSSRCNLVIRQAGQFDITIPSTKPTN